MRALHVEPWAFSPHRGESGEAGSGASSKQLSVLRAVNPKPPSSAHRSERPREEEIAAPPPKPSPLRDDTC
jgi:hypothetical protein